MVDLQSSKFSQLQWLTCTTVNGLILTVRKVYRKVTGTCKPSVRTVDGRIHIDGMVYGRVVKLPYGEL